MNEISNWDFNGRNIRTTTGSDGETWWIAKDVCDVLEHSNHRVAISRLDPDEKGVSTVYTPGGPQEQAIINESGLYSLILTSRKRQARAFKKWVTSVVLPAIRKTGRYESTAGTEAIDRLQAAVGELAGIIKQQQEEIAQLRASNRALGVEVGRLVEGADADRARVDTEVDPSWSRLGEFIKARNIYVHRAELARQGRICARICRENHFNPRKAKPKGRRKGTYYPAFVLGIWLRQYLVEHPVCWQPTLFDRHPPVE